MAVFLRNSFCDQPWSSRSPVARLTRAPGRCSAGLAACPRSLILKGAGAASCPWSQAYRRPSLTLRCALARLSCCRYRWEHRAPRRRPRVQFQYGRSTVGQVRHLSQTNHSRKLALVVSAGAGVTRLSEPNLVPCKLLPPLGDLLRVLGLQPPHATCTAQLTQLLPCRPPRVA